jgi:putative SOS response-associated peptidase YedK
MTSNREAIGRLFRVLHDHTANQPPLPAIYPDQLAPVVRIGPDGTREMLTMRWGFPPPPALTTRLVTNVRNTASAYWRPWLAPHYRCLVPATEFCEYSDNLPKTQYWFARGPDRPAFAFAGIWRPWHGVRKGESGEHLLFSFLTTSPNALMRPIHAKAMPVILSSTDQDAWLQAPLEEALTLQKPCADDHLVIVAKGEHQQTSLF